MLMMNMSHAETIEQQTKYRRTVDILAAILKVVLRGQETRRAHKDTDIPLIENEMTKSGIDLEGYKKTNLLHIRQIPDPGHFREGSVKAYDKFVKGILADLKQPSRFRIVSRAVPEVKKEDQITDELDVERTYHSTFDSFGGSLLCSYLVEEIEPRKRGKWIAELLQNHHTAIFLRKSGDGIAFNLE
jgi:hypothetical protein